MKRPNNTEKGFTIIELLVAMSVLLTCLIGILLTYINMVLLSDLARDLTISNNGVQAKMEEIKRVNYGNLYAVCPNPKPSNSFCNGDTFGLMGVNGIGRIEICDNTTCPGILPNAGLKWVRIIASFRSRSRVIGGDKNLNGVYTDSGETGFSPVEIVTLIAE